MTHHEGKMSEKDKESSERVQKQRAFEEGRGHDVTSATKATGAGGLKLHRVQGERRRASHYADREPDYKAGLQRGHGHGRQSGNEGTVTRGQGSQRGSGGKNARIKPV
jgi:hypothetical protein